MSINQHGILAQRRPLYGQGIDLWLESKPQAQVNTLTSMGTDLLCDLHGVIPTSRQYKGFSPTLATFKDLVDEMLGGDFIYYCYDWDGLLSTESRAQDAIEDGCTVYRIGRTDLIRHLAGEVAGYV